jgi:RNA polymerase-binding transcription factor DksA
MKSRKKYREEELLMDLTENRRRSSRINYCEQCGNQIGLKDIIVVSVVGVSLCLR